MADIIAKDIVDLGKHLKVVTNDTGSVYVMIPKCNIVNIGRADDYGYINLNESQQKVLRTDQIKVSFDTKVEGATQTDLDTIISLLQRKSVCPPGNNDSLAAPTATLSLTEDGIIQMGNPKATVEAHAIGQQGGYPLSQVVLDGTVVSTLSTDYDETIDLTLYPDTARTYFLYVQDSAGLFDIASVEVEYRYALYYGALSDDHDEFTSLVQGADIDTISVTPELSLGVNFASTFDCTGGAFIHILVPESFGIDFDLYMGGIEVTAYSTSLVNIYDEFNVLRNYYVVTIDTIQTSDDINIVIVWEN